MANLIIDFKIYLSVFNFSLFASSLFFDLIVYLNIADFCSVSLLRLAQLMKDRPCVTMT